MPAAYRPYEDDLLGAHNAYERSTDISAVHLREPY
jgi:hypothetical protein